MTRVGKRERWSKEFSEWYVEVLQLAGILDERYPVKGMYVWLPYGFRIRRAIVDIMRKHHDETGHHEVLFPLLIPEDIFRKEAEHIKGFENEVYWVTHGGREPLNVRLALRPTSETAIYPMFALWIRSHADMPLKIYQIVSVFRYETKHTRPLLRLREITTFKEAHTAHASMEDAERQVREAIEIYKRIFDELGVPYLISKRPDWDKFPGAVYTIAFDTIFPDGRTLQIGTVHNLGQNFSRAYNIVFDKPDGSKDYAYQTCYGMSDRVVASVIVIHGDDAGLCLPPNIAPIQVVVIPIPYKESEANVYEYSRAIAGELAERFRVELDERDIRPGRKFYEWEIKGVPLRIEVGPRDVEQSQVTLVRRDTGERFTLSRDELLEEVGRILNDIERNLRERAWRFLKERVNRVDSLDEARETLSRIGGVVELPWCGAEKCGLRMEDLLGASALGTPVDGAEIEGSCPICGEKAREMLRFARTY